MGHLGHIPAHVPTTPEITGDPRGYAIDYREIDAWENYSLYVVFKRTHSLPDDVGHLGYIKARLEECLKGTVVCGWYGISNFRVNVDLMIWALADNPKVLQATYCQIGALGTRHGQQASLEPVWCAMNRHLPTEFNESHLPACQGGFAPRRYMTVYPFVQSRDQYYLPVARRSAILKEHDLNGADYNDVTISMLAAFALGDWEWTVTLETDRMDRVVGVLCKQREVEVHLFVRVGTSLYTGVRAEPWEWVGLQSTTPRDGYVGLK